MKHSSTDEGMKSQKGSGLEALDYLESYRIGTSSIKEIPNPYMYENWLEKYMHRQVFLLPKVATDLQLGIVPAWMLHTYM